MSKSSKTHIHVFVTKKFKFRAAVTKGCSTYEVTLGGSEWKKGKGNEHATVIRKKCLSIIGALIRQYEI